MWFGFDLSCGLGMIDVLEDLWGDWLGELGVICGVVCGVMCGLIWSVSCCVI